MKNLKQLINLLPVIWKGKEEKQLAKFLSSLKKKELVTISLELIKSGDLKQPPAQKSRSQEISGLGWRRPAGKHMGAVF